MTHEIGPALRTTTIHEAYSVYKSYDGNAPDTEGVACCATLALAEEVAGFLNKHDPHDEYTEDGVMPESLVEFPWPYVSGWEGWGVWLTARVEVPFGAISTSFDEAIAGACWQ